MLSIDHLTLAWTQVTTPDGAPEQDLQLGTLPRPALTIPTVSNSVMEEGGDSDGPSPTGGGLAGGQRSLRVTRQWATTHSTTCGQQPDLHFICLLSACVTELQDAHLA